ncbi:hypothetical protein Taro_040101 [Colocasia esculenta]|uniref:YqaJ viral recombinase domain-containing protein n=1 Tax=Colocasia esculenta TaxID=4460 RepID=A0A843WP86_COLES|nr:hypothetical protein [Colocasia esculenta]
MTHAYSPYSQGLPPRKRYGIRTRRTHHTSSSPLQPTSSPLVLRPFSAPLVSPSLTSSDVPQRSEEWFALRKDKLTTSSFSTALGFWKGNRRAELWHQKVFAPDADAIVGSGKAAMEWGVDNESAAIEQYKSITGRDVGLLGFVVHAEGRFGWLGASPDGILGCHPDGGILEVKCPYNKGKPDLALPWEVVPYYYMPQVQGQMEIMDRDWVDLYCWTPNGSSIFRVFRERTYWELMYTVLRDFWWQNVMPAREALSTGREEDAKAYEPKPKHELTGLVIARSRKLAAEVKLLCKDIGGHVEFYR